MTLNVFASFSRLFAVFALLSAVFLSVQGRSLISYCQSWSDISSLNWDNVDIVNFAFAVPSGNAVVLNDPPNDGPKLQTLVSGARQRGKKVVLSIGGWNDGGFSDQVKPANRAAFIQSIKSIVAQYQVDGVDIDWEYPNSPGAGHPYSPDDTANLQTFLPALRKALGTSKVIMMAVPQRPWLDANGLPSTNLSQAASALSLVLIMNYDVAFSNVGPNAPYQNKCNKPYYIGAVESVALWRKTGFPSTKIALGVPFYAYNYVTSRSAFLRRDPSHPHEHAAHGVRAPRMLNERAAVSYTNMQTISFAQLVSDGTLVFNTTTGKFAGGNGYSRKWDSCSSTPYLVRNGSIISYDDPTSINIKGKLAVYKNLWGAGAWSMQGDYQGQLTAALRRGLNGS